MGKHERLLIEGVEKIIVKLLNHERISKNDTENRWFKHAQVITKKIESDFSDIKNAKHLGNNYNTVGDISFLSNNQEVFVETKMSETKTGRGTLANISQNALTDNKMFEGEVMCWSDFREKKRHDLWVDEYLDRFKKYPSKILAIKNIQKIRDEKARYLRKIKIMDKMAGQIMDDIQEKDREEKEEYLLYLSKQKQIPENIRRFFSLMVLGIHKKEKMSALINSDSLIFKAKKLVLYYSNVDNGEIVVTAQNVGESLKNILSKFEYFKIVFSPGVTNCKLVGLDYNNKITPLLQIVFLWKNIAQGIKTPCLNVFDLYSENF